MSESRIQEVWSQEPGARSCRSSGRNTDGREQNAHRMEADESLPAGRNTPIPNSPTPEFLNSEF